jgi:hypothetical protein
VRIEEIDKNFAVPQFNDLEIEWFDIRNAPFELYGLIDTGEKYVRLPDDVAASVNDGVKWLAKHTSGGRVRFSTDSPFIALAAEQPDFGIMPHMTILGITGFDLYCDEGKNKGFVGSFMPDHTKQITSNVVRFGDRSWENGMHSFTVNFPLYCTVNRVLIGLKKGARLEGGAKYRDKLPIVYYGSSITQGGCASRPGMCYESLISRINNVDHINLGFSGSARGEDNIAKYIRDIPMSVFVYDYDHNAPNAQHLRDTHERFFKLFREKQPDTPVIMLTRPCNNINDGDNLERRDIIYTTYKNAVDSGDKNVYFIDGSQLFYGKYAFDCLVDYCHPTDLGFTHMADAVLRELEKCL